MQRVLLPLAADMAENMNCILEKTHSAAAEVQVHRCMHALIVVLHVSVNCRRPWECSRRVCSASWR